eukprot:600953-Hanusia_phi.AAC.1
MRSSEGVSKRTTTGKRTETAGPRQDRFVRTEAGTHLVSHHKEGELSEGEESGRHEGTQAGKRRRVREPKQVVYRTEREQERQGDGQRQEQAH